jgi:MraZ protein
LFIGKHPSTLDHDNSFAAPASYMQELSGGAFILQGFERNLMVFPLSAFEQVYRAVSSQNLADPLARSLLRLLLGSAREAAPGANGRITLPDDLKEFAQVGAEMVIVGQGDFFEVWQLGLWEEQESQLRDAVANSSRFASLNVSTR